VSNVLSLLAEDSTIYSDGGGRVKAAGRPIVGADHASRFILGIWPRFVDEMERRAVDINGSPGLVMSLAGQVYYAFSFEVAGDRVRNIYIMCNPDKLRHLAASR
jgi:RNA polymerase sigma-70 factor (ECF subfamily)